MAASVLVAYAPRCGFTQEVAETVGAALREYGITVDVQPLKAVKALETCSAVVLGAPLQMSRWHKDALVFLDRHRNALARRAVAVFALGPFRDEEKEWRVVRDRLDTELAKFPSLAPVAVEVFGANTLGLRGKLIPALRNMPAGDVGELAAVKAWADTLPEKLRLVGE